MMSPSDVHAIAREFFVALPKDDDQGSWRDVYDTVFAKYSGPQSHVGRAVVDALKQERYRRRVERNRFDWEVEYAPLRLRIYEEIRSRISDEPCADNFRAADITSQRAVRAFKRQERDGCCGSSNWRVVLDGRTFLIGCNYGH